MEGSRELTPGAVTQFIFHAVDNGEIIDFTEFSNRIQNREEELFRRLSSCNITLITVRSNFRLLARAIKLIIIAVVCKSRRLHLSSIAGYRDSCHSCVVLVADYWLHYSPYCSIQTKISVSTLIPYVQTLYLTLYNSGHSMLLATSCWPMSFMGHMQDHHLLMISTMRTYS